MASSNNGAGGSLSILLGNGDGTFQPATTITAGTNPNGIAAGDFNGDGKMDLAMAIGCCSSSLGSVSVYLGNGDATFQTPVNYAVGPGPIYVAVGDFNGDHNLDLAVANAGYGGGNSISILLGNGDGTFRSQVQYATGMEPFGIVVADFNGDGKSDLAVTTNGFISVLMGNGDGTFQTHVDYSASNVVDSYIVASDLNGDGKLDLAAGGNVLLGNGDGTFRLASQFASGTGALVVADFNGDGKPDLAYSPRLSPQGSIQLGNGDGTFQKPVDYLFADEGTDSLAAIDLNGDGVPDLVAADGNTSTIYVMLSAAFRSASPLSLAFGSQGVGTNSLAQKILVGNASNVPFNVSGITANGSFTQANDCGQTLTPGQTCNISVTFSPGSAGQLSGSITVTDSTRNSPQSIPLSGIGVNGPFLILSPGKGAFGSVNVGSASSPANITILNTGNASVSMQGISITGTNNGDFQQSNNCSASIAVGSSCVVQVQFAPAAAGSRSANLSIADNAPGSPQLVALVGTGASLGLGIASGSSGTAAVSAGQVATYTLSIGGGGMGGTATLTCTGAPTGAECSFPGGSSTSVSATSATQFTVNVTTTSRTLSASASAGRNSSLWLWTIAVVAFTFLPKSRKIRRARVLPITLLLFLSACGSNSSKQNPNGTPAGTYQMTVTAACGSVQTSTQLTLAAQ